MVKKRLTIENRKAPRYNPEPDKAEEALFFKNEITIRFPCDSVEREVTDLSITGLKVFLEDKDPLVEFIGKIVKAILSLNETSISIKMSVVYQTEDEYGLSYIGCKFDNLSKNHSKIITSYLNTKKD